MRTEDLIRELAKDAPPVRRLQPLTVRLIGWVALAALSLAVVTMWMGARQDLGQVLWESNFQFEAAMLILTAMSAAVGALTVSVPGRERSALVRWLPIVGGAICILWVVGELVFASLTGAPTGRLTFAWRCVYKTTSVALVPGDCVVRARAPRRPAPRGVGGPARDPGDRRRWCAGRECDLPDRSPAASLSLARRATHALCRARRRTRDLVDPLESRPPSVGSNPP